MAKGKLLRIGRSAAIFVGLIVVALIMLSSLSGQDLVQFKAHLDRGWWTASFIRWALLLIIIVKFLPWFIERKRVDSKNRLEALHAEYDRAYEANAHYETLRELEFVIDDAERFYEFFESVHQRKTSIACFLIGIELLAVQLPHFVGF